MFENKEQDPHVTVFGGSQPLPNTPAYESAFKLGKYLGSGGYVVLTGGYIGTMEAVSRGVAEAGGHVIGVTCDEIESWRPVAPNPWIKEERRYPTLRKRLYALIDGCDIAMALPGGIGTLAEVAVMWSQLQTGASAPKPIILIGIDWAHAMKAVFDYLGEYISINDRKWLHFADSVDIAFQRMQALLTNR